MNSPTFFGTKSVLKVLPLTSKAASGYNGKIVRYWTKRNIPRFNKIRTIRASCDLPAGSAKFPPVTWGNCRQSLLAETEGNHYLRRFLPVFASNFTSGTVYLRPSQVNFHAPVSQCTMNTLIFFCSFDNVQPAKLF